MASIFILMFFSIIPIYLQSVVLSVFFLFLIVNQKIVYQLLNSIPNTSKISEVKDYYSLPEKWRDEPDFGISVSTGKL